MRIRSKLAVLFFVAHSFLLFQGCGSAQSNADIETILAELDNGKITGNVYENKVISIRLRFPKTMAPDTKATLAADTKEGLEQLQNGRTRADRQVIDEMIRKDRIVFTLDLPENNDSIGAAMSLTIKKDETNEPIGQMVERTVKFVTSNGQQQLIKGPSEESIGPLKAISFSLSQDVDGNAVLSKLYTSRRNGYLLTFSISYVDEKGLTQMETVLKGIEGL